MKAKESTPESQAADALPGAQAVIRMCAGAGPRGAVVGMALLASLLTAAALLPAYGMKPLPGTERDQPALLLPTPLALLTWFPWLADMDRRLAAFGGVALFCALLALLYFPLRIAGGVARQLQEAPHEGAALSHLLARHLKAGWTPWMKVSVGLLLSVGAANLLTIKTGAAPSFPAYPLQFSGVQNLAMTLPALIALPLVGLLIAVLSAAAGAWLRRPLSAVLLAYGLSIAAGGFVGMASREIPGTINEFLPPPGWGLWAAPGIAAGWLAYGLLSGLAAGLVWYVVSPSARGRSETAEAR